jgi:hypothetical protein
MPLSETHGLHPASKMLPLHTHLHLAGSMSFGSGCANGASANPGGDAANKGGGSGGSKPGTFVSTGNRLLDKLAREQVGTVYGCTCLSLAVSTGCEVSVVNGSVSCLT